MAPFNCYTVMFLRTKYSHEIAVGSFGSKKSNSLERKERAAMAL